MRFKKLKNKLEIIIMISISIIFIYIKKFNESIDDMWLAGRILGVLVFAPSTNIFQTKFSYIFVFIY